MSFPDHQQFIFAGSADQMGRAPARRLPAHALRVGTMTWRVVTQSDPWLAPAEYQTLNIHMANHAVEDQFPDLHPHEKRNTKRLLKAIYADLCSLVFRVEDEVMHNQLIEKLNQFLYGNRRNYHRCSLDRALRLNPPVILPIAETDTESNLSGLYNSPEDIPAPRPKAKARRA